MKNRKVVSNLSNISYLLISWNQNLNGQEYGKNLVILCSKSEKERRNVSVWKEG
jgi:hypothetical protein